VRLAHFFAEAVAGRFPPVDGGITIVPPENGLSAVVALTGHAGTAVFAAVSPGNARSLRAFLACGFKPVASEVLIMMAQDHPGFR
jgi:hypothetical protein